jgi:hypothetical protein
MHLLCQYFLFRLNPLFLGVFGHGDRMAKAAIAGGCHVVSNSRQHILPHH